jgi:hypothetical protein
VTALAASRAKSYETVSSIELVSTAETVWKGGIACFDTSTGLVKKGVASTTLLPIGYYTEDKVVASGGTVLIELFKEIRIQWFANASGGDAVVASTIGGLCYILDDQTVAVDDETNARSVAGRVWKLDAVKGVCVEMHTTAGDRLGGLDA